MSLEDLRQLPICLHILPRGPKIHESNFRSYHCLEWVRQHLSAWGKEIPAVALILEVVDDVMNADPVVMEQDAISDKPL